MKVSKLGQLDFNLPVSEGQASLERLLLHASSASDSDGSSAHTTQLLHMVTHTPHDSSWQASDTRLLLLLLLLLFPLFIPQPNPAPSSNACSTPDPDGALRWFMGCAKPDPLACQNADLTEYVLELIASKALYSTHVLIPLQDRHCL